MTTRAKKRLRRRDGQGPRVYEQVTADVLAKLEEGVVPWRMPFRAGGGMRPISVATGKPYRGVNVFTLGMAGHASPYWLTYKQCAEKGGQVRKGERSRVAMFWKQIPGVKDDDGNTVKAGAWIARAFRVFNAEQVDGLDPKWTPEPELIGEPTWTPDERAEAVTAAYLAAGGPTLAIGGGQAFYDPNRDHVQIPDRGRFDAADAFHRVTFHELGHSTGAPKRLDRRTGDDARAGFGSPAYAREELVAELTAAMVCAATGVSAEVETSAGYIDNWRQALSDDTRLIVQAASKAQKAADLILAGVEGGGA